MKFIFPGDSTLMIKCFGPTVMSPGVPARADGAKADTYLRYAISDFTEGGERGRVNALGNCKRAVHLAVDEALAAYGLLHHSSRYNFPQKLNVLETASLLPVSVFRRLNIERNLMEHEYATPEERTVSEAIDITRLLCIAVADLRRQVIYECVATTTESDYEYCMMRLVPGQGELRFHRLDVPQSFFAEEYGVRFIKEHLRNQEGIVKGVEVDSCPTHTVPLKLERSSDWAPILGALHDESRDAGVNKGASFSGGYMTSWVYLPIPEDRAKLLVNAFSEFTGHYKTLFSEVDESDSQFSAEESVDRNGR